MSVVKGSHPVRTPVRIWSAHTDVHVDKDMYSIWTVELVEVTVRESKTLWYSLI